MTDGRSRLRWGVAAVALAAAVVLLVYTALGPGLVVPSLWGEGEGTDLPNAEIEFHPNPDSMTVYYGGGGTLPSDQVYVEVGGGQNQTWASWDVDVQPGQPLDAGEELTIPEWSEGQSVRVYYVGNESSGALANHDP